MRTNELISYNTVLFLTFGEHISADVSLDCWHQTNTLSNNKKPLINIPESDNEILNQPSETEFFKFPIC